MTLTEYLASGALIKILRLNTGGNPPSVWITPTQDGAFQYGPTKSENSVGGQPPPFGCVNEEKIFTPNVGEVTAFLRTFGLSEQEAASVVRKSGTSPSGDSFPAGTVIVGR